MIHIEEKIAYRLRISSTNIIQLAVNVQEGCVSSDWPYSFRKILSPYLSKITFNSNCASFSIKVQIKSTIFPYNMLSYSSISDIPLEAFKATRQKSQYFKQNLDINFTMSHDKYIVISHISENDFQTYLNAPKGAYTRGVITKFTMKTTNMCPCNQTIVVEIMYSRKDLSSNTHFKIIGEISNTSNVMFLQDVTFEYRTIFVKALNNNHGLVCHPCSTNLLIDPLYPIALYKGPMKLLQVFSCCEIHSAAMYIITPTFEINLSWQEASSYCESIGGHLPIITSLLEENFLTRLMEKRIQEMAELTNNCKDYPLCYIFLGLRKYNVRLKLSVYRRLITEH